MSSIFALLGLGILLFASTNIDDIFVLLTFFADPQLRPRQVIAGQFAGIAVLYLLSIVGAVLALAIAPVYVGLLGLAPLGLGLWKLRELRHSENDDDEKKAMASSRGWASVGAVALVTIANGGDNIGVYVPVFSTQPSSALIVFGVIFLLMTALWCLIGYSLVNHPKLGSPIKRYAKPITPFVLILLGIFILVESKAYSLVF